MAEASDILMEKQFLIEQKLRLCKVVELKTVAAVINVVVEDNDDGKKILRKITEVFDSLEADNKENCFFAILPHLPQKIRIEIMKVLLGNDDITIKRDSDTARQDVSEVLKAMGLESGSATSAFRKELKITGSIGRTQKDRISYINLCSQVEDAKARGYSSEEISQAIRRSVSSGSELRTVLDAKTDMPLETVLTFVRGYLQEKTAEELYKDLNDMVQADDEDPQSFVLRAMGVREKIIKASDNEEGSLMFNVQLIQNMFLRTLKTGLRDPSIKAEVKDILCIGSSDSDILTALNRASLEEEQSKLKRLNATKKKASVNKLTTSIENDRKESGNEELKECVKMLTKEMSAMRKEMDGLRKKDGFRTPARRSSPRGCESCRSTNQGDVCSHCWICGSDNHKSYGCNQRKKSN